MFKVDIKGDIGESTINLIDNAIQQADNDIMLAIDSNGGSLSCGMLCYDRIRESGKNFYANVVGSCMSSATLLLVACPLANRTASAHSTILIHNPLVNMGITSLNDVKGLLGTMEDAKAKLVQIYAERTLMSADEVSELMDKETELYATDCVKKGLIAKTNHLYNYNKKIVKNNMKKSFISMLTNKIVKALLNEAYTAEDGTELEISAIEVGGTCSQDGIFVVKGYTITSEDGVITDVIAPQEEVVDNEGEEKSQEKKVEEVAETVQEVVEKTVEQTVEEDGEVDATEVGKVVKEIVEESLKEFDELKELVEKCGGKDKLKALCNVKHSAKVFNSVEKKDKDKEKYTIKELVEMKRNRK